MELKETQKKRLKRLAHDLKPVVMIGQHGLKDSILEELDIALDFHQLIKVKISVGDRDARDELVQKLLKHANNAVLVQKIGNIAVFYQKNPKKEDLMKA
uniref:FIG004454: RNA binding protein n=1 Tax=uncultured Thiotrichaceae bacterium TaxID=298394 RepID=A0A6S6T0J1_9GAMM|nr:MAG: FIG004454: RNA binding protein [uncultured Thiotrichaceae bacterium]